MGLIEAGRRTEVGRNGAIRRTIDVTLACALLLAASPILLGGVLLVLLAGGRPVFFGHRRLGQGGRPFRCWKLRTMEVGAEEILAHDEALRARYLANGYKLPSGDDPRVPEWGRILRRSYVDEIPQLVNVLVGEMSLVGPRPIVPEEVELFGPEAAELLRVKPGVFGAWNSQGRERPPYPVRAEVELEYVRNRSWWRDLRILVRSVRAVFQGQGDG